MKRIFLLSVILMSASFQIARSQTNDTLAILQNIVANKSSYIGQSFTFFNNQLPIAIKHFLPLPGSPRNLEKTTAFAFYYPANLNVGFKGNRTLVIQWQQPLDRRQSRYLHHQTNGAWSTAASSFYASSIIADISIL